MRLKFPDAFKIHSKVEYMNRRMHCRHIVYHSVSIKFIFHSLDREQQQEPINRSQLAHPQARLVGGKVTTETVVELELDQTGYVVCQKPSSYVFEDVGEDVVEIVVGIDVEFDILHIVDIDVEDGAAAEVYSTVGGGVMVMVCCLAAVTVTVAAAGVTVTTKISVVSWAVTVAVDVSISVPAGTISVETIVNVVWGAGVCVVISITVVVAPGDPPAVGDGAPPSTGTTEYDALGISNGFS